MVEDEEDNADNSMKFFKSIRPKVTSISSCEPSTSNAATNFINECLTSQRKIAVKPKAKTTKRTKKNPKSQTDIKSVLSKQEQLFNYVVTENCLQEGIDPDEMQLALAISESLKNENRPKEERSTSATSNKFENPFSASAKVQPIGAVLESFGFKFKTNYSEFEIELITSSKGMKKSKFQKFPTLLTRTTSRKRNEMISAKIDAILERDRYQNFFEVESSKAVQYRIFSFYLQELYENGRTTFAISSEKRETDEVLMNYYVTELFEPSFVKADHLLKDWSKIPGRDPTPVRGSSGVIVQLRVETETVGSTGKHTANMNKNVNLPIEVSSSNDSQEANESKFDNASAISCEDIFEGFDDFEIEHDDDFLTSTVSNIRETSEELAGHFENLQDKLSHSLMEVKEDVTFEIIEATMNPQVKEIIVLSSDNTEPSQSETSKPTNQFKIVKNFEHDVKPNKSSDPKVLDIEDEPGKVDLAQKSSNGSNATIPHDDSFHSLHQYLKKQRELISLIPLEPEVFVQDPEVDSVSSDDEVFDEPNVIKEEEANQRSSEVSLTKNDEEPEVELSQSFTQNSFADDDEVIEITDEEINYTMQRYHKEPEEYFNNSREVGTSEEESIDLTQEVDNPSYKFGHSSFRVHDSYEEAVDLTQAADDNFSQFDVNNLVDHSLIEVMNQNEALNINDTISNLLETSVCTTNLNATRSDCSTMFLQSEVISDSLREIMERYETKMVTKEPTRSFRKVHSDSVLINDSVKRRRTTELVQDQENYIDHTQHFKDKKSKENSIWNSSVHQSLENIIESSPMRPHKQIQRREGLKISLGLQIDEDYTVDTEEVIPEPDFQNMTPIELKLALYKYGIRPLPVKKAITLLEYIYDHLYPNIRNAAEEEIDVHDSRRDMNITDIMSNIGIQDDDPYIFQLGLTEKEEFVMPKSKKSKVKFQIFIR